MENELVKVHVAVGVIIKQDGKYLLVQEKMPSQYGLWNWPAGKVDVGETIEHAAIREAKEEVGYDVELIRKLDIWHENTSMSVRHGFEAKIIGGELNIPPDELLDAKWFTVEEIKGMEDKLRSGWILGAIEIMEGGGK